LLHTVAMARSSSFERGNSLLFTRSEPKNIMEAAIDSFLDETDDESCIVEYWARQEWKNIEAHVDIDEERARFKRPFRHPKRAHVCYLAVGRRVRAPTCVWERTPLDDFPFGALTSVPAVAGRVLRFDGSLQHAVPYPTQIWLHSNAAAPVCDAPEELDAQLVQPAARGPASVRRACVARDGEDIESALRLSSLREPASPPARGACFRCART
jgi:hypothetical protein